MKLVRIDCNKGRKIDGGFLHTVFESMNLNGEKKINILSSVKFNEVLVAPEYLENFRLDPIKFLEDVSDCDGEVESDGDEVA